MSAGGPGPRGIPRAWCLGGLPLRPEVPTPLGVHPLGIWKAGYLGVGTGHAWRTGYPGVGTGHAWRTGYLGVGTGHAWRTGYLGVSIAPGAGYDAKGAWSWSGASKPLSAWSKTSSLLSPASSSSSVSKPSPAWGW